MKHMKGIAKTFKSMDKILLFITVGLFVFGLLNIVTASSQVSVIRYSSSLYNYFIKQLIILLVGTIVSCFILKIPTKSYRLLGTIAFIVIAGFSIGVSLYGENYSGNQNWINVFGFMFQPSEFAKPVIIICLAMLFEKFYQKLRTKGIDHYNMIAVILFVGCFFPAIIFLQRDLGTMIVVSAIFGCMFLVSPILRIEKFKMIVLLLIIGLIGIFFLIANAGKILTNAQSSRFQFFDPCSDYEEGGYQICNGFIAINSGGLLGVGIGNSKQKSYIPESHTDSVFAIIGEEYGFLVTSLILILYIVVLYRILRLSSLSNTIRGQYICFGIAIYIFLHILINLGGLFGLMPLTGIPLPFLSYGGSFTLSLVLSLAVVQRIHIEYSDSKKVHKR